MAGEFTKYGTVATVMQKAMSELGLTAPNAFVGSVDPTVTQLLNYLTSTGQDLCLMNDWQYLHKEWTQILAPAQTVYPLPVDWNSFVDSTMWNNASSLPVIGPLTPQVWRLLKARFSGGTTISLQYRIIGNTFTLFQAPSAANTIQADYFGRGWILMADNITYRDNVSADSDQILFDTRIVVPFLKYKWRNAKGFDTTSDSDDFDSAWDLVVGRDTPAPTLSIGPRSIYPYLGYGNINDTGYGS